MKVETKTIDGERMLGVTIREPRKVKFLKFTAAELATIRRACEVLEAADTAVLEMYGGDPRSSLHDHGEEDLARGLFTGDIREMLSSHGQNGIELHDSQLEID